MDRQLTIAVHGRQILGKRKNQEDSFAWTANSSSTNFGTLCIVSDGMGGMARGEEYSQSAVSQAQLVFTQRDPKEAPGDVLLACYAAIHKAALGLRLSPQDSDGGATVVMVLIRDGKASFLSVGDSRIVLLRGGGLIQLNREQILGPMLDERAALGMISEAVASGNRYRSSLLNHTNMDPPLPCDLCMTPFTLAPGDQIALMSDGVGNALSDDELIACLRYGGEKAEDAVMRCIERKNRKDQDNSTLILVDIYE